MKEIKHIRFLETISILCIGGGFNLAATAANDHSYLGIIFSLIIIWIGIFIWWYK